MTPIPPDPTGHHPIVDFCKRITRCLKERTILAGPGIRLKYETGGTRIVAETPGAIQPGESLRWRGEWTAGTPPDGLGDYKEGDIVIRGSANVSRVAVTDPPQTDEEIAEEALSRALSDLNNGTVAGTFVALRDLATHTAEPSTAGDDWELLGRSAYPRLTIKHTGANRIALVAVPTEGSEPGNVSIDINDCHGKDLAIMEVEVCRNGVTMYMLVLGCEPYATSIS